MADLKDNNNSAEKGQGKMAKGKEKKKKDKKVSEGGAAFNKQMARISVSLQNEQRRIPPTG